MVSKIKVGIIGAAGYTGGELLRILLRHEAVDLVFAHSNSQASKAISTTHTDLVGDTALIFSHSFDLKAVDVVFLCSGHGQSAKFLKENFVPDGLKIIDLSTDFRDGSDGFVYGLPELKFQEISKAKKIANPGCFATAIQLAILPLAKAGLLSADIHVSAITGSTGAGQSLSESSHFSWRNNNVSIYKAFTHQHLTEINASIKSLMPSWEQEISFIPYRGNFTRGIMANVYTEFSGSLFEALDLYKDYYKEAEFTHIIDQTADLKMVINTNKCLLELQKHGKKLLITSIIDNLTKGASGQAVQNMNIMFGLSQSTGLLLKPSAF
jgi:N-acetyl-gamma-glutamyl-phosphate reductase